MSSKLLRSQTQAQISYVESKQRFNHMKKSGKNLKFSSEGDNSSVFSKKVESDLERKLLYQVKTLEKQVKSLKTQVLILKEENQELLNRMKQYSQFKDLLNINQNQTIIMNDFTCQFKLTDSVIFNQSIDLSHKKLIILSNNVEEPKDILNLCAKNSTSTCCSQVGQSSSLLNKLDSLQSGNKSCVETRDRKIEELILKNISLQQKNKIYKSKLSYLKNEHLQLLSNVSCGNIRRY